MTAGDLVETRRPEKAQVQQRSLETRVKQKTTILLAYGGLALPLCLAEIPIVLYLPAFYAQELHLSTALVGLVFLLARVWDGASDLVVGWLSDRSISRLGRRKPWVIGGAPFLMASTWFLCNPPRDAGLLYLAIWAAAFYTAFTAAKIPHLSWGTELATDYVERSRVTSFREGFTVLGNLIFVLTPLLILSENPRLREVLFLLSMCVLWTVPVTAAVAGIFVDDPARKIRVKTKLFGEAVELLKDRILVRFVMARLFFAVEEGVTNSLLLFSFSVGLQLPNKLFWAIFVLYIASLAGLPFTLWLAARVEKHLLLATGISMQAMTYAVVMCVPKVSFGLIAVLWTIIGLANSAMLSLPTSILADIIDEGEVRTGQRRSGTYVAIDNLIYKVGMALGVGVSFGLLSLVGFDPGAVYHGAADERNIRLLGFGLPCLLSIPAIILYLGHPITRAVQRRLRDTINSASLSAESMERVI
jgi:glycoside/pentoside/hexuronide:cation symporter, GPH family